MLRIPCRTIPPTEMRIDFVTLFPAMLEGPLAESIPRRIQEQGLVDIRIHDLRTWGLGRHHSVDDSPYGGGAGMVLRPEPVAGALEALRGPESTVILLDPGGEVFRQARAAKQRIGVGAAGKVTRAVPEALKVPH